jgi:hypothetical protein
LVAEGPHDLGLHLGGLFNDPLGFAGRARPAKAGMQEVHLLHDSGGGHRDPGALETNFNEAQIGKGNHTFQTIAVALTVGYFLMKRSQSQDKVRTDY